MLPLSKSGYFRRNNRVNLGVDMKNFTSKMFFIGSVALFLSACDKTAAPKTPPPPKVNVVIAHAESVPVTRDTVGLLASSRVAQVRARVAGIVLKQVYKEGTDVEQGQVLFQIDPSSLKAALHANEAALARAQADAKNATLIAKRSKDLAARGLLASQSLDTALANQRTSAAAVKQAQANVEKTQLDLKFATVTAPIAGYAGRALVTEGALVGENEATQLTTVEQIDPIFVNFSQSVGELQQLQQGTSKVPASDQPVDIILPNGTTYSRPGKLDFASLVVDSKTGTVSLRAVVPNPDRQLLPGMFVKLRVTQRYVDNAFLLPQAAVLRDSNGAYVLLVAADGKVKQGRVKTQAMTQTGWIVTGDLTEGEQVIVSGLQKVRPGGMAVAVSASNSNKLPATKPAAGH